MRLFGIVNNKIDEFDRGPLWLSPFTISWGPPQPLGIVGLGILTIRTIIKSVVTIQTQVE